MQPMKFKIPLIVRESVPQNLSNRIVTSTKDVISLSCLSKGISSITCKFDKNAYSPEEVVNVITQINNKNCHAAMLKISLVVKGNVILKSNSLSNTKSFSCTIRTQSLDGVKALEDELI